MAKKGRSSDVSSYETACHKSPRHLIQSKERFNNELANNIGAAWRNRAAEYPLYSLYNQINSQLCNSVEPPNYPKNTMSHSPQFSFTTRVQPHGEPGVPITNKRPYLSRTPDYVRTIVCGGKELSEFEHILVDFWEIKTLNTEYFWATTEASNEALKAISAHMEQIYTTAMAAFAHHPDWTRVYALLIIGVYFSQFVWDRPVGKIKRQLRDIPVSNVLTAAEMATVIERHEKRKNQYQARTLPRIEYYNAPVFTFHPQDKKSDECPIRVSLSPQFLYAVREPFKEPECKGCKFQASWLSAPSKKPAGPALNDDPDWLVQNMLIDNHIQTLDMRLDALRVKSLSPDGKPKKESPAYKPSYSVRKAVLQSPLAGKISRPRRVLPGIKRVPLDSEDDEDEEEQDDDLDPPQQCALPGSGTNATSGDGRRGSQSEQDEEQQIAGGMKDATALEVGGVAEEDSEEEEAYTNDTTVGEEANQSDADEVSETDEVTEEEETETEDETDEEKTDEETDRDETNTDDE